ncbi:MAG: cytochrome [Francisellaceae bacterium]|nr:cytochrome [Francisellaceae bacterium]
MIKTLKKILLQFFKNRFYKKAPGPSQFDFIEDAPISDSSLNLDYALSLVKKYGAIIRLPSLRPEFLIADVDTFEYVLKSNAANYPKQALSYLRMRYFFGESFLLNSQEKWKKTRLIVNPAFHKNAFDYYAEKMVETSDEFISKWLSNTNQVWDFAKEIKLLSLKIAFTIFGNLTLNDTSLETLSIDFEKINKDCFSTPILSKYFYERINKLNINLQKLINERQKINPQFEDVLTLLTNKQIEGNTLSSSQILDEFKTIIVTGHETVASALSWVWYLLGNHPNYWQALKTELKEILKGKAPTYEDLPKLLLTKAIFLETLRLYPPVWCLQRTAQHEDIIKGYYIPKKSSLLLNIYALHRNPNYWSYPDQFIPERFYDNHYSFPEIAFLPFSFGSRTCVAQHIAITEGIIILARIAQKIDFNLVKPKRHPKMRAWISLTPDKIMVEVLNASQKPIQ